MKTVIRHLESGRLIDALQRMLDLWPNHRDAVFADQIDRLGDHLDRAVPAIPKKRRHAQWIDRLAQDQPADIPALMAVLPLGSSREMKERIDALCERSPDPRTTRALLAWGDRLQSTSFGPWGKVWTALFKLVIRVGDPRMTAGLRAFVVRCKEHDAVAQYPVHAKLVARIEKALAKFPSPSPPVDVTALAAALDVVCAGPRPKEVYRESAGLSDEIRDRIYEDPFDDGPIQVWADLLSEAGDDLGTFVTLQLRAEHTPLKKADVKHLARLRKANLQRLLGPLAAVVDPHTASFRRGLLTGAKVNFKTKKLKNVLREHPYWRSVRQILTDPPHLRSGALPNVRRIGLRLLESTQPVLGSPPGFRFVEGPGASWTLLRTLAKARSALPIEAFCVTVPAGGTPADWAVLEDLRGLPQLRELHLHHASHGWRRAGQRAWVETLLGHPSLRSMDRLVLDQLLGERFHLQPLWERLRTEGQELVVLSDTLCFAVAGVDGGLGLHVSSTDSWRGIGDFVLATVGDPRRYQKVEIEGPTWHGPDLELLALAFEGRETRLPKRKRGT